MTTCKGQKSPSLAERMMALIETARLLHPPTGNTQKLLAHTLSAPRRTIRGILYDGRIVSAEKMDRWCDYLEAGIEQDAKVAADRVARARRSLHRARGRLDAAADSFIGSDPHETDGAAV